MRRPEISSTTTLLAALVLVSIVVSMGFGLYYLQQSSVVTQLQSKMTADEDQISTLSGEISSLQSQYSNQQSAINALNGVQNSIQTLQSQYSIQQSAINALNGVQNSIQTLQSSLESLQSQIQSASAASQSNSNQLATLQTTIQNMQSQVKDMQGNVSGIQATINNLQPQTPLSTLVVIQTSFDNSTNTESLVVQNAWNGAVSAQLQAYIMCITRPGAEFYCPNPVGSYTSNIMQLPPESTTTVTFSLSQFTVLSSGTMDTIEVYFVAAGTQLSQQYTLMYP
jgi:chaperonin cofactor prefoldin